MRKAYSPSHANRGAVLERLIDMTNQQYRNKGVADIRKIPTPVQITSNKAGKSLGTQQKANGLITSVFVTVKQLYSMQRKHLFGQVFR